jgi:GT2 family glycosyltransferase
MHVSVVIVGFRNAADIVACLAALETASHTDFEVVICENGGVSAHADLLARTPASLAGGQPVRVILAPGNLGFAGGVNVGMNATAHADAWWLLNPDTQPEPLALSSMVARLAAGDCDAVGCTLYRSTRAVQSYGGRWRGWLARAESIGFGAQLDDAIDAADVERTQTYLNGASMLMSRRFIETTGLMREDYFLYCEEVEWCLRGLARGMRLGFAQSARVLHAQGTTTGAGEQIRQRPRMPVYLGERNKMLLTRDHFPARLPVVALAALILLFARFLPRSAWRQLGYGFCGWWAGLRNERGPPAWARG